MDDATRARRIAEIRANRAANPGHPYNVARRASERLITGGAPTFVNQPAGDDGADKAAFDAALNAPLPEGFAMPSGPESEWTARDYQAAANVAWIRIGRVDRSYPNYRPVLSVLEAAHARYTRRARAMRGAQ